MLLVLHPFDPVTVRAEQLVPPTVRLCHDVLVVCTEGNLLPMRGASRFAAPVATYVIYLQCPLVRKSATTTLASQRRMRRRLPPRAPLPHPYRSGSRRQLARGHVIPPMTRLTAVFQLVEFFDPYRAAVASAAKVRKKESARFGDLTPRLRISSFASICTLPEEVIL